MACTKNKDLGTILYSTTNDASLNIVENLQKNWAWKKKNERLYTFSACGKSECCTGFQAAGFEKSIIEIEPDYKAEFYLYASTHKSEKGTPALTAHFPGNWGSADFGGNPKTLNTAYACKLKQILKLLDIGNKELGLNWEVNAEVDHHGPTPQDGNLPLIFVEIGSTQKEWVNPVAGKIVASAMFKALIRPVEKFEAYIAFGGGHYAPAFGDYILGKKLLDGKEIAISHICPKYRVDELDESVILQAVKKTIEPVEGALIDWKGLSQEQREKIVSILDKEKIKWVRA